MQLDNHKESRTMHITLHTAEMEKFAKERATIESRQKQIREQERKEIEQLQGEHARALHKRRQEWQASLRAPEPPVSDNRWSQDDILVTRDFLLLVLLNYFFEFHSVLSDLKQQKRTIIYILFNY